eukprot:13785-Heterococcus_DN1.PRE.1
MICKCSDVCVGDEATSSRADSEVKAWPRYHCAVLQHVSCVLSKPIIRHSVVERQQQKGQLMLTRHLKAPMHALIA